VLDTHSHTHSHRHTHTYTHAHAHTRTHFHTHVHKKPAVAENTVVGFREPLVIQSLMIPAITWKKKKGQIPKSAENSFS